MTAAKEFGPREHAMFLFAVAHGARAQEIANLRLTDINFNNEQIHIARLKGSLDSTQNLLKVKGNALFDEKAALKAWLAVREPDADNFVFNSQKSTQLNRVTVYKLFQSHRKESRTRRDPPTPARPEAHRRDADGPARRECLPYPPAPRAPLV